jgi:hypothetical protein
VRCPERLVPVWRRTVELARWMATAELNDGQAAEKIAAEGLSARPARADPQPAGQGLAAPRPDPDETRDAFPPLDWSAVAEAIPVEVSALVTGCAALDAFGLDERLRMVVQALQRIDWQMGRLLRVFFDRRLFRSMGFPSAARYVRERLGLSERKARALVAVERKSWEAPALGEAYRAGVLSGVRALTLLPVVSDATAAAWVARARVVTVRRLADEVEWAAAAREAGPPPLGARLDDLERQIGARPGDAALDAEISFCAPASAVAEFRTAVLAFTAKGEPLWRGLEHLLEHVKAEWENQPGHRDPVFARDRWRCMVPACSSRRELHDHHILFRSRGGTNARGNRVTVCASHHLHGIHAGHVRARGEAPDEITWTLGAGSDRPALAQLRGDRYLYGAP